MDYQTEKMEQVKNMWSSYCELWQELPYSLILYCFSFVELKIQSNQNWIDICFGRFSKDFTNRIYLLYSCFEFENVTTLQSMFCSLRRFATSISVSNVYLTPSTISLFSQLEKLVKFTCHMSHCDSSVSDDNHRVVFPSHFLQQLYSISTNFVIANTQDFSNLKSFEVETMSFGEYRDQDLLQLLHHNTQLKHVSVHAREIQLERMDRLRDQNSELQSFCMFHSSTTDDTVGNLIEIIQKTQCNSIKLVGNYDITTEGVKSLVDCLCQPNRVLRHVEHLSIQNMILPKEPELFQRFYFLKTLALDYIDLSEFETTFFANIATNCSQLQTISLQECQIGDENCIALLLDSCSFELQRLYMNGNNLTDKVSGIMKQHSSTIQVLELFGNSISNDVLLEWLLTCSRIHTLSFDTISSAALYEALLLCTTSVQYLCIREIELEEWETNFFERYCFAFQFL